MTSTQHLSDEARAILNEEKWRKRQFLHTWRFVPYPAAITTLRWLQHMNVYEARGTRPHSVHILSAGGNGKTRLLRHYTNLNIPTQGDSKGRRRSPVVMIETIDGEYKNLGLALLDVLIPGYEGSGLGRRFHREVERWLKLYNVRQVIIDEAGNLLLSGKQTQQRSLAFIKRLTNLGITVAIATAENMSNVLGADQQLYSRFRQVRLPIWTESQELRVFLAGLEAQIPLPAPSNLASEPMVRCLLQRGPITIGDLCRFVRWSALAAIELNMDSLTLELLNATLSGEDPPEYVIATK